MVVDLVLQLLIFVLVCVKVNGKLKRMTGFDEEHIKNQLWPRKATMIRKVKDA